MTENEVNKIKDKIALLFSSQKLGVLSTCGKNGPYANLISFAVNGELKSLLFVTPKETHKFANMQADNRVALLVENSQNKLADFQNAMAITATGVAEEIKGEKRNTMVKHYLEKHPNLEEFVNSDGNSLMEIRVNSYVLVENFQSVKKLNMA